MDNPIGEPRAAGSRDWCSWRDARSAARQEGRVTTLMPDLGSDETEIGPEPWDRLPPGRACAIIHGLLRRAGAPACPRCRGERYYGLKDGRFRCAACHYTYHEMTGRWLARCRLPCDTWIDVVRLFEASKPVDEVCRRTGLSRSTILKATHTIRSAIYAETPGAESWRGVLDDSVFGLVEFRGNALANPVGGLRHGAALTEARWRDAAGGVVHAGPYGTYPSVLFAAQERELDVYRKSLARGAVFRSRHSPFWRFAVPYFKARHGVRSDRFPLYLKEALFRYNNRKRDLVPQILTCLSQVCPDFGTGPKTERPGNVEAPRPH